MEQLLTTKLFIPQARPELVLRPRLVKRLNQGLQRKLTLISAPAGFGKTTLVSEWVHNLRKNDSQNSKTKNQIAWLSLDEGDNEPARFLAYLITALARSEDVQTSIGEGALDMLQSPKPPPAEAVLTDLLNELAALPGRMVLVLDDYHLIESLLVDDAMSFFIEHLPPGCHLVIITRIDPALSLPRLRVRGQLIELRAADLRFTRAEAAEFLNQVMGLNLSTEDVAALETRTEGWIAGLQMAAISMQGQKDPASLIQSFTGSHRFVLDYLIEEVLEQQPKNIQSFLLHTAVLEQLTGSLCDALTGQENGQETLEMLDQCNLFIVPLDKERRWYRYHQLFADLLRKRLRQKQPDQIEQLHIRASAWYQQNGFMDQAIEHALRSGDFERAAGQIQAVSDALWGHKNSQLKRWLEALPPDELADHPQLSVFQAWFLLSGGRLDAAQQLLQTAEHVLDQTPNLDEIRQQTLRGRIAAARAFSAFYRGDTDEIIQQAELALEILPETETAWRSTAIHVLGDAYDFSGQMGEAYLSRVEAVEVSRSSPSKIAALIANLKLAIVLRHQGRLVQVQEICRQQRQTAEQNGIGKTDAAGWLLAICGEVLAETNDLEGALQQAQKGVELVEPGGDLAILSWSYICLTRILFSMGNYAQAGEVLRKMAHATQNAQVPPLILDHLPAWLARIWLAEGELETASQWAATSGLDPGQEVTYLHEMSLIVLARVLIAEGRMDEADLLLQNLREAAQAGGRTSREIEILTLQALSRQAQGETDQALTTLERALNLAEPGGLIRSFVDEGPALAGLLYEALARGIAPAYTRQLLAAFPETEPQNAEVLPAQSSEYEWIEPLSEREIEVLQLIAEGLTNPELADRLYLSLNTVKVHTRNIYSKLGVNNRTSAVARARALGILSHS